MGVKHSEVNYELLIKDMDTCCLGEETCKVCNKKDCIIGFAQTCAIGCMKNKVTYVENGAQEIPVMDFKVYEEGEMAKGIAHILKTCRSCKEDHFDNCIISVLRNCYEVGLFGEKQPYEGSNFKYLSKMSEQKPEIAQDIIEEFNRCEID